MESNGASRCNAGAANCATCGKLVGATRHLTGMTKSRETELTSIPGETGAGLKPDPERPESKRDPEARPTSEKEEVREKQLDKTLADSFPTSDPPSSIPDPSEES